MTGKSEKKKREVSLKQTQNRVVLDGTSKKEQEKKRDNLNLYMEQNKKLSDKLRKSLGLIQQLQMDMENLRKSFKNEREKAEKFAILEFTKDICSGLDSVDRAISTVSCLRDSNDKKAFMLGFEMIKDGFSKIFKRYGVERIVTKGVPFDPKLHEAVQREKGEKSRKNIIIKEVQAGYTIHGRLLRASKVIIAG